MMLAEKMYDFTSAAAIRQHLEVHMSDRNTEITYVDQLISHI